jgi:cytochrome c556
MHPMRLLPLALMLAACGAKPESKPDLMQDASWTGLTRPMEVIKARGEVMEHMELLMEPIDTIQVEPVRDAGQLRLNAEAIAAMLGAVPHLFPPTTNLYDPKAEQFPTLALPAIWKSFDTFYELAMAASRTAEAMGETKDDSALKAASAKLRASCDACHTLYLRKYVPQKPQQSDYDFDFDAALGHAKK